MDGRLEVRALLGATPLPTPLPPPLNQSIAIDDSLDDEAFLKTLEETLQQHAGTLLEQHFLVLSASQVELLALRLHDVLVPKRDAESRVIQAWTIQPQLQLKVKASAHIQVLKLSTILREVRRLRVHQFQSFETPSSHIEVDIFPSLKIIEALNMDVLRLRHVHYFARQLKELHIEHTDAKTLRQLLAPEDTKVLWTKLLKLHLNCCWNKINKFDSNMTTKSLEVLNLCHNQLKIVPPIQALRGLRELDLAVNQLVSLKGLEILKTLERLDVSHNLIDDITEVELLTRLPRLMCLKMEFNPIARRPDYRREVLFYLGESIELDGHRWSEPEISSMKNRRMLMMLNGVNQHNVVESRLWRQSEKASAYPRVHVQSGTVVKNPKLVLSYPRLPQSQAVPAHFVEIQNPLSAVPTMSNQSRKAGDGKLENGNSIVKTPGNNQGSLSTRPSVRTVDDYFRTQRNVIASKVNKHSNECEEQATTTEGEYSDDCTTEQTWAPRCKHSTTNYMQEFEEEELLMREGNDIDNADMIVATSQTQIPISQRLRRSFSVRVLLSAKESALLGLHFGINGVPANIKIKPRKLVERYTVSDGKDPIAITRWLPDVVAVGTSIHSHRAKIITMKLRTHGSPNVTDAAYQFDSAASLETLLLSLVARLLQQYRSHIVICNCANCGALSLLTPRYPERIEANDPLTVYSCLLCSSCNVREISFKKLVALCANEGIVISSSIPLGPPPWEAITEGFYIEEPFFHGLGKDEVHSDEWSDAIVHAMATSMR
ncbi:unnamed protein product [Peronospora destructor]|uniref:Dynein axonemal light chain 1 n=1 Tax=Peronospora destructor TaxID=86335 RepID=A0AAV0T5Q4_9STRA|nr:unnamed protein product [Peronospora destructor]